MHKLIQFCIRLFNRAVLIPVLWMVEPFRHFRFTPIYAERLAHLATNTYFFASERILEGPENGVTRFIFGANPCNDTLFQIWKRYIPLIESHGMTFWYNADRSFLNGTRFFEPFYNPHFLHARNTDNPRLVFQMTSEEKHRGARLMEQMGLGANDWFVCFQARDSAYHVNVLKREEARGHRNCDIKTYLKAAQHVTDLGGAAIRLGSTVAEALPDLGNPRIIDYPVHWRSDFGDIFLPGHCRFFLSCSTGVEYISHLFNVPVGSANCPGGKPSAMRGHSYFTPKLMRDKESGNIVPFRKFEPTGLYNVLLTEDMIDERIFGRDFRETTWWKTTGNLNTDMPLFIDSLNIDFVDNTEDDILDLCLDLLDHHEGNPVPPEARELQLIYKRTLFANVRGLDLQEFIDHAPNIGPRYALKYAHLIDS